MKLLHSQIIGEGFPLIILHGFLGMGDNWRSLGNRFSKRFQVHLIDQRNHGRSFQSDDFSYELMVEDLLYYLEHYKIDKAHFLGHSMGGKTAMLFAVEHPDRVERLIVADIAPKFYPPHHQFILAALNDVDFSKVQKRSEIDEVFSRHIAERGIRQFLLKNVYRIKKDRFAYRINLESLEANIDEIGVGLPPRTIFEGETLFLKGENSGYIAPADEPLISAHFPNSRVVVIPRGGHWLHAENPEDFYKNVVEFLEND